MIHEYAVEPEAIATDWARFRYLAEKFGFEKGRLISRFPKKWEASVHEAIKRSEMRDVERKKAIEKLLAMKRFALVPSRRDFDPNTSWLDNALAQHKAKPFNAIISETAVAGSQAVLVAADLDENTPLFQATTSWRVLMTNDGFADGVAPLLCAAKEVMIVDPYFEIISARYAGPLIAMMQRMSSAGIAEANIQIHRKDGGDYELEVLKANIQAVFGVNIPEGFSIEVFEWQRRKPGPAFHDRYVLCDCGGIASHSGFGTNHNGEDVLLTALPLSEVIELAKRFRLESAAYDLCRSVLCVEANGDITQRGA
ncbi:MAG: hypothetical protein COA37_12050 [Hoeflea sp.]|uniref:hypothetical protein n=1 Tax=Hoeflea sp. TaxID=1940281 RepID=UPI000C0EC47D|nr:hypothetical protein [Hoeflea sp.]PHR22444.1 MAG: hypothetical protein COA37_12050 [Hoeflea sp.]